MLIQFVLQLLLHFLQPDVAEADIRRITVVVLADHAALAAEEVRVLIRADRLGIAEGALAAILVLHGGKPSPVPSAVIQPLCALQGYLLLFQRNQSCILVVAAAAIQSEFQDYLLL